MNASVMVIEDREALDRKMIDIYAHEDALRVPIFVQNPCRICGKTWYLSEAALQFHQVKRKDDPHWKFPTSCPTCRPLSRETAQSARRSGCSSGKMDFDSKEDAEFFHRKKGTSAPPQYAYFCSECKNYHLTSRVEQPTTSGPLASPLGRAAQNVPLAPQKEEKVPAQRGETRDKVARLLKQGCTPKQIAEKLDMTITNVAYHIGKLTNAAKPAASSVEALDADELDAKEKQLYAQLEEIERKKKRLAEAKMLRVELHGGGIRIAKEGEHMILPFADREQLILLLMQLGETSPVAQP